MGKVIGGGLPAAAYGGSRALMERIAPAGDVYQAGTLSGNPLAVAAGLATLRAARRRGLPAPAARPPRRWPPACATRRPPPACRSRSTRCPGLLTVFFSDEPRRATTPAPRPATTRPTPPGAAACWPAASTRRRRSTRRGSRRWPTPPSTSTARSTPPPRRSRSVGMSVLARLRRPRRPRARAACSADGAADAAPRGADAHGDAVAPRGPRADGHAADLAARHRGGPRGLPRCTTAPRA